MTRIEVIQPKTWTSEEAYHSGRIAYRIFVMRINNPFLGNKDLWQSWDKGWRDEAEQTKYSTERHEYVEERSYDRNSRSSREPRLQRSNSKH